MPILTKEGALRPPKSKLSLYVQTQTKPKIMSPKTKKVLTRFIIILIVIPIMLPGLLLVFGLASALISDAIYPDNKRNDWGPSYQDLETETVVEYITDFSRLDIHDYDFVFTQREITATIPSRINDYFAIRANDELSKQIIRDTTWWTMELDNEEASYERGIINYIITESNRTNEMQLTMPDEVMFNSKWICSHGNTFEMYYDIEKEILYGKFHLD